MVRIKARTMAVNSYAPKNGFRPIQLDQGSDSYSPYLRGSTYQQPCPPNMPPQQLYDFTNEVWASAATGYPECSEVRNLTAVHTDGRRCWCHTAPVLTSAAFGVDERIPEWISGNFQLQTTQAEVDIHCHVRQNVCNLGVNHHVTMFPPGEAHGGQTAEKTSRALRQNSPTRQIRCR